MSAVFPADQARRSARPALTLVEATISVFIVGVLLVAALYAVGGSLMTREKTADRRRGMLLAQDLMSEILRQHYEDPGLGPGSFGVDGEEVGDGTRALWNDVDDYQGWSASPPQQKDGTELAGFDGWGRSVLVSRVTPANLSLGAISDTGVKQITVTVTRDGAVVATLVAVKTSTWPEPGEYFVGGDVGDAAGTPENSPPRAKAHAAPANGPAPLTVLFGADGSSDADGDPLSYAWDFGDGQTGTGIVATHAYSAGSYVATLTVSDGRGGSGTDTVKVKAWEIVVIPK